jgi:hypothetical protein
MLIQRFKQFSLQLLLVQLPLSVWSKTHSVSVLNQIANFAQLIINPDLLGSDGKS